MSRSFTVSILGTLPPLRALSSYCFEFAHAISQNCKVEFISFKKIYPAFLYPGGDLDEDHTYPVINTSRIRVKRRLAWYNPLTWIAEGIFTRAAILHAQWWSLPLFPIYAVVCAGFKLRGKPVVFTVHNVLPHEKSRLYSRLSGLLFRFGDHFIVHADSGKRQMVDHYHILPERISVIPHGSLDFHVKRDIDPLALRKELGFDEKDKIILLFGAIRPYKGIDIALNALPDIVRHVPEAKLLIAGKLWEDWEPYDRLIRNLNIEKHLHLHLEYIPSGRVHQFFEAADMAIFPYRHFDSQSGAGATAVAFHKPMVVTRVGGLPELAADQRCVVEPNDPNALAEAVITCLTDPEIQKSVASNIKKISRQLDWTDIAKKTEKIYRNLITKG